MENNLGQHVVLSLPRRCLGLLLRHPQVNLLLELLGVGPDYRPNNNYARCIR